MKKKKIVRILVVLLCLAAIAGVVLFCWKLRAERKELIAQAILKIEYRKQNKAFPRVSGHPRNEDYYVGYDAIDEAEMYVWLAAYNEHISICGYHEGDRELTLADIEEYLSGEYNEDGSLRIHEGYENIRAYMDWYYEEDGDDDIAEYWGELTKITIEYNVQNPELVLEIPEKMNIAQLQELIHKKNDPAYEINKEVMKE